MPRSRTRSGTESLTTLLHLVRLGVGVSFTTLSTGKIGDSLGLSQQSASLRLVELEKAGLVERAHSGRGLAVRLTDRGLKMAEGFLIEATSNLELGKRELRFRGSVFTGLSEGAYYIGLGGYSRGLREFLGSTPFPGTLNLRLQNEAMIEQRRHLDALKGYEVQGFSDDKRSYGPIKCFRAKIAGRYPGAVLVIDRTHYDSSVLEVIAPVELRRALSLKDGDECAVSVLVSDGKTVRT